MPVVYYRRFDVVGNSVYYCMVISVWPYAVWRWISFANESSMDGQVVQRSMSVRHNVLCLYLAHGRLQCSLTSVMHAVSQVQVEQWQIRQRKQAEKAGYVCTLLGRQRRLPDASKSGPGTGAAKAHALRAAINTPVQGSAADVAAAAMISINKCARLETLGWKLLLQVQQKCTQLNT